MSKWIFEGWVYADGEGKLVGPVAAEDFVRVIGSGRVQPTDRVWTKWKNGEPLLIATLAKRVFDAKPPTSPFEP
jgi:hypothetical protein